jgi:hypothetical protein
LPSFTATQPSETAAVMQDSLWRTILSSFAIGVLIEYGVFLAISTGFSDKDPYFSAFLMLLLFWGIQVFAWIKDHIVSAILRYFNGKRQLVDILEGDLRLNKMPVYDDQMFLGAEDYIARVAVDERSQKDQLIFAGSVAGALNWVAGIKPSTAWRIRRTLDAALKRYSESPSSVQEMKRSSAVADDAAIKNEDRNGYKASPIKDLSDEGRRRQKGKLLALKAKTLWASGIVWGYHNKEIPTETADNEWRQYLKFKDTIYHQLEELTDEFFRATAMQFIIDMLVVAQEVDEARNFLGRITIAFIKKRAEASINAGPRAVYEEQRKAQKASSSEQG